MTRIGYSRGQSAAVAFALVASTLVVGGASAATSSRSTPSSRHSSVRVTSVCSVVRSSGVNVSPSGYPCVVTIHDGAHFRIALDTGWRWSNPTVSSSVVRLGRAARGANGGLQATVGALALGRATLAATGTIICKSATACPALARRWSLQVVVSNAPGPRTYFALLADNGKTFTMHEGDRFILNLIGPTSYTWTVPKTNVPSVLSLIYDTMGTRLRSGYLASAPGVVRISAVNNPSCYPQCLPPSRLFRVNVKVVK